MKTVISSLVCVVFAVGMSHGGGNHTSLGKYATQVYDYSASAPSGSLSGEILHGSNTVAKINALYDMMLERVDILDSEWSLGDKTQEDFGSNLPSVEHRSMFSESDVFTRDMARLFWQDVSSYFSKSHAKAPPTSTGSTIYPSRVSTMSYDGINVAFSKYSGFEIDGVELSCGNLYVPTLTSDYECGTTPVGDMFSSYLNGLGITDVSQSTDSTGMQAAWIDDYFRYGASLSVEDIMINTPYVMAGKLYTGANAVLGMMDTVYFTFPTQSPKCKAITTTKMTRHKYPEAGIISWIRSNAFVDYQISEIEEYFNSNSSDTEEVSTEDMRYGIGGQYHVYWVHGYGSIKVVLRGNLEYTAIGGWEYVGEQDLPKATVKTYSKRMQATSVEITAIVVRIPEGINCSCVEVEKTCEIDDTEHVEFATCSKSLRDNGSYVAGGHANFAWKETKTKVKNGEQAEDETLEHFGSKDFNGGEFSAEFGSIVTTASTVSDGDKEDFKKEPCRLKVTLHPVSREDLLNFHYYVFKQVTVNKEDPEAEPEENYTWEANPSGPPEPPPVDDEGHPQTDPDKGGTSKEDPQDEGISDNGWYVPCSGTIENDTSVHDEGTVSISVPYVGIFGSQTFNLLKW